MKKLKSTILKSLCVMNFVVLFILCLSVNGQTTWVRIYTDSDSVTTYKRIYAEPDSSIVTPNSKKQRQLYLQRQLIDSLIMEYERELPFVKKRIPCKDNSSNLGYCFEMVKQKPEWYDFIQWIDKKFKR